MEPKNQNTEPTIRQKFYQSMQRDPLVAAHIQMYQNGYFVTWEEMLMALSVSLWERLANYQAAALKAGQQRVEPIATTSNKG